MTCEHKRYLKVSAKADDRQHYEVPHIGLIRDGYAPWIAGLSRGDYLGFRVCLDCCKVIDMSPMDEEEIVGAFT